MSKDSFVVRFSGDQGRALARLCDKTRFSPAKIAHMLVGYALEHVKVSPTTAQIYDLRFVTGDGAQPSAANTYDIMPQLRDKLSGLK